MLNRFGGNMTAIGDAKHFVRCHTKNLGDADNRIGVQTKFATLVPRIHRLTGLELLRHLYLRDAFLSANLR